jgi:hypothetical protein
MKRKIHQPLVLDEEASGLADAPAAPPEVMNLDFVDAEPDRDLDMSMFEPTRSAPEREPSRAGAVFGATRLKDPAGLAEMKVADGSSQPLARSRLADSTIAATTSRRIPSPEDRSFRPLYAVAAVVTVIWAVIPLGFFAGYAKGVEPLTYEPFAFTLLAAWAVGSVGILWVATRMLGQSLRLGDEVRHARAIAEDLLTPAAIAAAGAGSAIQVVRREIDSAVAAAAQARHELITLREVLATETAKLAEAATASARTVTDMTGAMGSERQELGALSSRLGIQVAEVEDAIGRQARMVAEASDLAETQIREAEAVLASRAADLAAAAGDATDAARVAGEDLSRQAARLEAAGVGVGEQIRVVEQGLTEQRAALVSVSVAMRADQEDFAAQVESQQAQLSEVLVQARAASRDVETAANASSDALRTLIVEASEQYQDAVEATVAERDLFAGQALQSIGALSEAARHERERMTADAEAAIQALSDAAERAQAATEAQTEATRQRIDNLGEAAFTAGQKANDAFEARLTDARALIEQSAELIEEAGRRTSQRLTESLASAQGTLAQLEGLLQEVDARTAAMPEQAKQRGDEVKAAVEQGVEELINAAKRAADETQAIDAAFQERVRRNYEMLSEAVRMMGVVSGSTAAARPARPAPRTAPATAPLPEPAAEAPAPSAEDLGLRPRLRFAAPEAPANVPADSAEPSVSDELFEPEAPPSLPIQPAPQTVQPTSDLSDESWTWKEILNDLDAPPPPAVVHPAVMAGPEGQDTIGRMMLSEIRALGIDPAALLPPMRTAEIALVLRNGDTYGARQIVRRLAPAAMRRLSRRVLTEPALRARVAQFLELFEGWIDKAASADRSGEALDQLMATEEGRGFLLYDAALGDSA